MRYQGNYSASEDYHHRLQEFDRKQINPKDIKKRWFRNHYAGLRRQGYFNIQVGVYGVDMMIASREVGLDPHFNFYGPFWSAEEARSFINRLKALHDWFIMTGD